MSKKLTPWFPGYVKPVWVGVYQREYGNENDPDIVYCKWDGKAFHVYARNPYQASINDCESSNIHNRWRGLAEPPK